MLEFYFSTSDYAILCFWMKRMYFALQGLICKTFLTSLKDRQFEYLLIDIFLSIDCFLLSA